MKKILLSLSVLLIGSTITKAQTILTRWTFDDSSVSFPSPMPGDGTGTAVLMGGTTTAATWPAGKGTGKRASVTTFPAASAASGTAGISFATSTQGKAGISLCYYLKLSKTASRYHQVKYSTDGGTTWNPFVITASNTTISNVTTGGYFFIDPTNNVLSDTGSQASTFWGLFKLDFTGISGVDNNPNFRVFITTVFNPANNTSYAASGGASNYGTGGTYGFDSVTISYGSVAPVKLKGFNASVVNNLTKLTWTSENEINVAGFELEKSIDGKIFTTVNTTNSTGKANYSSSDIAPKGITYYRLKINNLDGSYTYSNVISVNGKKIGTGINIYPNPASSNITVSYVKVSNNATINIYTTDGKLVTTSKLVEGSSQTTLDVSTLKSGKYVLTMNDGTEKQSTVLIKQ